MTHFDFRHTDSRRIPPQHSLKHIVVLVEYPTIQYSVPFGWNFLSACLCLAPLQWSQKFVDDLYQVSYPTKVPLVSCLWAHLWVTCCANTRLYKLPPPTMAHKPRLHQETSWHLHQSTISTLCQSILLWGIYCCQLPYYSIFLQEPIECLVYIFGAIVTPDTHQLLACCSAMFLNSTNFSNTSSFRFKK